MARIPIPSGVYSGGIPAGYILTIVGEGAYLEPPSSALGLSALLPGASPQAKAAPVLSGLVSKLRTAAPYLVTLLFLGVVAVAVLVAVPRVSKPSRPDWLPAEETAKPAAPVPAEWRPIPWAPGWEGHSRDEAGRLWFDDWRPIQSR